MKAEWTVKGTSGELYISTKDLNDALEGVGVCYTDPDDDKPLFYCNGALIFDGTKNTEEDWMAFEDMLINAQNLNR